MITVKREVKATLSGVVGRVLAWHNDSEKGSVSLAVPGDRAKLSPAQARELARWLNQAADECTARDHSPLKTSAPRTGSPLNQFAAEQQTKYAGANPKSPHPWERVGLNRTEWMIATGRVGRA